MTEIVKALKNIGSDNRERIKINSELKPDSIIYASVRGRVRTRAVREDQMGIGESDILNGLDGLKIKDLIGNELIQDGNGILYVDTTKFENEQISTIREKRMFAAIYCRPIRNEKSDPNPIYFLCNVSESIEAFTKAVDLTSLNKLV